MRTVMLQIHRNSRAHSVDPRRTSARNGADVGAHRLERGARVDQGPRLGHLAIRLLRARRPLSHRFLSAALFLRNSASLLLLASLLPIVEKRQRLYQLCCAWSPQLRR